MPDTGWTKVESGREGEVWDFEANKEMTGTYLKRREHVGDNDSTMYFFQNGDNVVAVWGNGVLDTRMSEIPLGSVVKIVYLGKEKSQKSKFFYKNYDVFFKAGEAGKTVEAPSEPF